MYPCREDRSADAQRAETCIGRNRRYHRYDGDNGQQVTVAKGRPYLIGDPV